MEKCIAEDLYNLCVKTCTVCLADDGWQQLKNYYHIEPSQCEAVLLLTIQKLCGRASNLEMEVDRLRKLHIPTTARDVHDVVMKERARTGATLDEVISHILACQIREVPFDIIRRGFALAKASDLNPARELEDDPFPF